MGGLYEIRSLSRLLMVMVMLEVVMSPCLVDALCTVHGTATDKWYVVHVRMSHVSDATNELKLPTWSTVRPHSSRRYHCLVSRPKVLKGLAYRWVCFIMSGGCVLVY